MRRTFCESKFLQVRDRFEFFLTFSPFTQFIQDGRRDNFHCLDVFLDLYDSICRSWSGSRVDHVGEVSRQQIFPGDE